MEYYTSWYVTEQFYILWYLVIGYAHFLNQNDKFSLDNRRADFNERKWELSILYQKFQIVKCAGTLELLLFKTN